MKIRFKLGMVTVIVLALMIALSAGAVGTVLKSWRTENGNVIQGAGDAFLSNTASDVRNEGKYKNGLITAKQLNELIEDTITVDGQVVLNTKNDPLILDVRAAGAGLPVDKEYGDGHIKGAIFIAPWSKMAKPENLDKLDEALACHMKDHDNDLIVLYCHTGHTAGLATSVLGSLGYNVKNLRFGYYVGWKVLKASVGGIGINSKTMADYDNPDNTKWPKAGNSTTDVPSNCGD